MERKNFNEKKILRYSAETKELNERKPIFDFTTKKSDTNS